MKLSVPHYKQTTEFTCGPACVMMVLGLFDKVKLDRKLEFEIWRECNMIGSPGSDVFGLAIPLLRRGLGVRIVTERRETIPLKRIVHKWGESMGRIAKYAMTLSYENAKKLGACISFKKPKLADVKEVLDSGTPAIILVNMYELHRYDKYDIPHWVVVSGYEGRWFYLNDPSRRKGQLRVRDDTLDRAMNSLATKIGASRSLVQAQPLCSFSL